MPPMMNVSEEPNPAPKNFSNKLKMSVFAAFLPSPGHFLSFLNNTARQKYFFPFKKHGGQRYLE